MLRRVILLLILMLMFANVMVALAQEEGEEIDLTPPVLGEFDAAAVAEIVVEDYPVLPELTDHARVIYERGQEAGNNPQAFSKVGDCMTAAEFFMVPFGVDEYNLAEYADLEATIEYFSVPVRDDGVNAFSNPGLATTSGFNTASVLDPIWANPEWCESNESPLSCEYRVVNPAFSIIMFGTNDVMFIDEASFDYYLRTIVLETISKNIVPVLTTFPTRPEYPEKTTLYNQIIISVAEDYDLPLINLWMGLQDLENGGVDELEPIHLSIPVDGQSGDFETNMGYGYTYRNLVTLQALDILVQGLAEEAGE